MKISLSSSYHSNANPLCYAVVVVVLELRPKKVGFESGLVAGGHRSLETKGYSKVKWLYVWGY